MAPPRNSCPTRGSFKSVSAVSDILVRPSSSTRPSSDICNALRAFCSTIKMVTPLARRSFRIWKISCTINGDKPMEGSSIKIRSGSSNRPRAISTSFCCPPDKVEACAFCYCRRIGNRSIAASMRASISRLLSAAMPPSSRLWRTDNSGKILRPCGT